MRPPPIEPLVVDLACAGVNLALLDHGPCLERTGWFSDRGGLALRDGGAQLRAHGDP